VGDLSYAILFLIAGQFALSMGALIQWIYWRRRAEEAELALEEALRSIEGTGEVSKARSW
jgi:hypothetical protein